MRADQLRGIIAPHLPPHIEIDVGSINPGHVPTRSLLQQISEFHVVIVSKRVGYGFPPEGIQAIRDTGVRLGVDHVDADFSHLRSDLFDFHIGASIAGTEELRKRLSLGYPNVVYLPHHADPRILQSSSPENRATAVYLGNPKHMYLPRELEESVTVLSAKHQNDATKSIRKATFYNLHYAVRPQIETTSSTQFRPFTKGFNAAAAGANIIVQRSAVDATRLLGDDYPYLVAEATSEAVIPVFKHATESFGSAEWLRGLEAMKGVLDEVSPHRIASHFVEMVSSISQ